MTAKKKTAKRTVKKKTTKEQALKKTALKKRRAEKVTKAAAKSKSKLDSLAAKVRDGRGDEWYTPKWLIDAIGGPFDFDPCAPQRPHWTAEKCVTGADGDGLTAEWEGCVWLNPPFTEFYWWLKKFSHHGNGVALAKTSTETNWAQDQAFLGVGSLVVFPDQRIEFVGKDGQPIIAEDGKKKGSPPFSIMLIGIGEGRERLIKALATGALGGRAFEQIIPGDEMHEVAQPLTPEEEAAADAQYEGPTEEEEIEMAIEVAHMEYNPPRGKRTGVPLTVEAKIGMSREAFVEKFKREQRKHEAAD